MKLRVKNRGLVGDLSLANPAVHLFMFELSAFGAGAIKLFLRRAASSCGGFEVLLHHHHAWIGLTSDCATALDPFVTARRWRQLAEFGGCFRKTPLCVLQLDRDLLHQC